MAQANRRTTSTTASSYDRYIAGGYYSHTSQAYKLEAYAQPAEYEPERPARRPSPARKPATAHPQRKVKKGKKAKIQRGTPKPKTVYKINMQNHRAFSPMSFLLIVVVFGGIVAWVSGTAFAAQRRYALSTAQATLKTIKQENSDLLKDLYEDYDLVDIEYVATVKLGMTKPEEHQIIHVNVPKQSYNVQYDNTTEENLEFSFFSLSSLMNFFVKD